MPIKVDTRRGRRVAGLRGSSSLRRRSDWAWLIDGWAPADIGAPPATESEALGLPPFGRGVELLANAVASTEWLAKRFDPATGVDTRLPAQPPVLTNPYPATTPWGYRWAATEDGVLYGNHFALVGDNGENGYPAWLVPVPATDVWLMVDPDGLSYWWVIGGQMFAPTDVMHVSYGNRSGEVLGRGKLLQYAEWLGTAVAAERHSGAYFAGGALPPAVLQSPSAVTQAQADSLKAKWREMTSTREPVVLPQGYSLVPVVSNAEQAQLVESRQWNAETVAMLLGIPAYKLGLPGASMTYQNIETADIDFVRDCVDRYARPLAEAFTKWLMPRGTSVSFDYASRMRADQTTTASVLTSYTGAGILTKDEARSVLGRPPLELTEVENTTPEDVPELTPTEVS